MQEYGYRVEPCCDILHVSRSAYYRWLYGRAGRRVQENERIAALMEKIHTESPDKGYRRIRDDLERYHDTKINDKRALRICRSRDIRSTIKYANHGCTRNAPNPQYIAENILNREFHADSPNEKWLTDVTEFKWYEGIEVHKVYLSAILDLYDRRIVSYVIRNSNDNPLVFDTVDAAITANPDAHPLFHSDRGFQYTSRLFQTKLQAQGIQQSMSRVGHCIDNGPTENFWGIVKSEMYYLNTFTDGAALRDAIANYMTFYITERIQARFGGKTPAEVRAEALATDMPAQYPIPVNKRIQKYKARYAA